MKFSSAAILLLGVTESAHAFSVVTTPPTTSSRIVVRQQGSYSSTTKLYGILDEIQGDDYQLGGGGGGDPSAPGGLDSAYEIFLGELVFSTNDPRMDIMNSPDQAFDPNFLTWMSNKAEKSQDPDERLALKDLYNMILDVKKTVELSAAAKEREAKEAEEKEAERIRVAEEEAAAGREMSNTDVLKKAAAIGSMKTDDGSDEEDTKVSFYDEELTPEIRLSYEDTLKKVLPPYKPGESPQSVVKTNYDQFDAQFIKVLSERASNGDDDSSILLDALAEEQNSRIAAATEHLKTVLAAGEPMRMEGVIVKLARDGKIDEPFLLLLEANETQARDAGATGPAELMKRLRLRAAEEKDKMVTSKEIRLIRKLLRADNSEQREKILEDAFTPRGNLLVRFSYVQFCVSFLCGQKCRHNIIFFLSLSLTFNFRCFCFDNVRTGCWYSRKCCKSH